MMIRKNKVADFPFADKIHTGLFVAERLSLE
jgi:hypothetical protein